MKKMIATPVRLALVLSAVAAVGAFCPEPLRGLLTVAVGLAGPTWMVARVARRYLSVTAEVGLPLGLALTLAGWALCMLGLLAVGLKLSRPEVIVVTGALLLAPAAVLRSWDPELLLDADTVPSAS